LFSVIKLLLKELPSSGEALHGVGPGGAWFGEVVPGAISFLLVINSATAFNESLWRAIGGVLHWCAAAAQQASLQCAGGGCASARRLLTLVFLLDHHRPTSVCVSPCLGSVISPSF